jgi:hypothetical protein
MRDRGHQASTWAKREGDKGHSRKSTPKLKGDRGPRTGISDKRYTAAFSSLYLAGCVLWTGLSSRRMCVFETRVARPLHWRLLVGSANGSSSLGRSLVEACNPPILLGCVEHHGVRTSLCETRAERPQRFRTEPSRPERRPSRTALRLPPSPWELPARYLPTCSSSNVCILAPR